MRILFVTRGFPSDDDPMLGNYEAIQASAIAALGHHVSVVCFRWKSIFHLFDRRHLPYRKSGEIDVYELVGVIPQIPFLKIGSYKLNRWIMQQTAKRFAKYYKKNNTIPDVIHIHSQYVAKYAVVLKKEFNVPVVLTEHFSGLNLGSINRNLLSERQIYQNSDAIIAVSHVLQAAIKEYYGIESRVINNMVDDIFFNVRREGRVDDCFTFVSVGRLVPIKCFDCLIKAVSLMKQKIKFRLLLVGDGPEYGNLDKLIIDLQLQEKIQLVGLKTPDEVSSLLCNSDCFVLSSHRETFGIVLIEAMAKGLPVISTKCGGPEEFVNESNGLLVEPNNSEELAMAMDYMVLHANEYDGEKIRQFCLDNFSRETIAKKIENVYLDVFNKHSKLS